MVRLNPLDDENNDRDEEEDIMPKNDAANAQAQTGDDKINTWYYYLEVSYTQVQPLALKEKEFNPENKFIQVHNGHLSLAPAFKEYQLLNTIEP